MKLAVVALAVTMLLAGGAARASAAECRATAIVEGADDALVDAVAAALARHGVATQASASCPSASVRVERRASSVWIAVTDPHGRTSERTLVDVEAAASLVESWARQDMNSAALLGWVEPAAPAVTSAPADTAPPPRRSAPPHRDRVRFGATGELSVALADAALWTGGRVSACVRVGPTCIGAAVRGAASDSSTSNDALGTVDVLVPLAASVELAAGAGVGAGIYSTPTANGEATTTFRHTSVRLDVHTELAFRLANHISLRVALSAGHSPTAVDAINPLADVTHGEPSTFVRGDLGLQIGIL